MFHTGNADFSVGTIKCFSHCPTSTLYLCINMSWLEQMQQYMSGFWGRYSKSDEKPDIYRCIYKYILDMWQLGTAARWDRFRKKIKS